MVGQVVSLGIGSPASIEYFVLVGLSANPAGAPALEGQIDITGTYTPTISVTGASAPTITVTGTYAPTVNVTGRVD